MFRHFVRIQLKTSVIVGKNKRCEGSPCHFQKFETIKHKVTEGRKSQNIKQLNTEAVNINGIYRPTSCRRSWGSSVSIGSYYRLDDRGLIPGKDRIFPLASVYRPALKPTQPPVQRVMRDLSPGLKRGRGVMLTTHPHLVPRLIISRSYTASLHKRIYGVSWNCSTFYISRCTPIFGIN
jgi:hypothetical protein